MLSKLLSSLALVTFSTFPHRAEWPQTANGSLFSLTVCGFHSKRFGVPSP